MLKNCIQCGKVYEDFLDLYKMCPDCREEETTLLRKVKDYLWDYPGSTEAKLHEIFGVTHEQVTKWLREERLEITPESNIKLTCVRCGSMILKGKYCDHCRKVVGDELESLKKDAAPKVDKQVYSMVIDKDASGKMHFVQGMDKHRHISVPKEYLNKTKKETIPKGKDE